MYFLGYHITMCSRGNNNYGSLQYVVETDERILRSVGGKSFKCTQKCSWLHFN